MTRALKKLVVIGDSATLSQFDFYSNFISRRGMGDAYQKCLGVCGMRLTLSTCYLFN